MNNKIKLKRDCDGVLIPSGHAVNLKEGTDVYITQALGGSFTLNVSGNLARIDAKDADAIGQEGVVFAEDDDTTGTLKDRVWRKLKTVFDPEIPVNIVDLGLIYDIVFSDAVVPDVSVTMTLTAAGCGMGPVLVMDVERVIRSFEEEVGDVKVDLVFDPPWDKSLLTEEAKLMLGMI